ncbi:hypothetical protein QBC42DRAFT_258646, partial [Cladorrhinum samala]
PRFSFHCFSGSSQILKVEACTGEERISKRIRPLLYFWEYRCLGILIMDTDMGLPMSHTKWEGFGLDDWFCSCIALSGNGFFLYIIIPGHFRGALLLAYRFYLGFFFFILYF